VSSLLARLRPSTALLLSAAAIAVIVATWVLVTPIAGGPDEPAHLVRAAALARGDLAGVRVPDGARPGRSVTVFEVPRWLDVPTPCFALLEQQPASCAGPLDPRRDLVLVGTSARAYPIWGHVLPGLGTLVPSPNAAVYSARLLGALVPVLLLAGVLTLARSAPMRAATTLAAVTPMAWFSFAVVNPSGLVIAGGLGTWAALLGWSRPFGPDPSPGRPARMPAALQVLLACSWALLVLPRRDGLIWATIILAAWLVLERITLAQVWRGCAIPTRVMLAASTAISIVWAATSGSRVSQAQVVVPLGLVVVLALRWLWTNTGRTRGVWSIMVIAAGGLLVGALLAGRPGGIDLELTSRIINDTGRNLYEAIGMLGWLDTPVPLSMVLFYAMMIGLLAGIAVAADAIRDLVVASAVGVVALVASWVLELYSGNTTGTYWQGRYFLPLLVGIPMLLDLTDQRIRRTHGVAIAVAVASGIVVNAAFVASARRWGVGTSGSAWPWRWDTYGAAVAPMALAVVHALAWVVLIAVTVSGSSVRGVSGGSVSAAGSPR